MRDRASHDPGREELMVLNERIAPSSMTCLPFPEKTTVVNEESRVVIPTLLATRGRHRDHRAVRFKCPIKYPVEDF